MMKSFKQYLSEGDVPIASTQREVKADLNDPVVIDELNRTLSLVTGSGCVNPYSGLVKVSKVLSTYGISLPQITYLPEPNGEEVFEVQQWGVHPGYTHRFDGTKDGISTNAGITPYQGVHQAAQDFGELLYVYFSWDMNVNGTYDVFAMVVDNEGLENVIQSEQTEEENEPLDEDLTKHERKLLYTQRKNKKLGIKPIPSKYIDKSPQGFRHPSLRSKLNPHKI